MGYLFPVLSNQGRVLTASSSSVCCVKQIGCGPVDRFTYVLSAVPVQCPPLAPSEQPGSGWWLQPAGSHRTAQAELSATPVLH